MGDTNGPTCTPSASPTLQETSNPFQGRRELGLGSQQVIDLYSSCLKAPHSTGTLEGLRVQVFAHATFSQKC